MESTPEKTLIPKFANIIFWIGLGSFIGSVIIFLLLGTLEDSQVVSESFLLYNGQRISSGIMYYALWLIGPAASVSIFVHAKWWAKGVSLLLFFYVVFMIWVMQPSG